MSLGNISGIKNESVGYISRSGTSSDLKFYRKDFSGAEWNREELMGKPVSFSSVHDEHGKIIAKSVRLV